MVETEARTIEQADWTDGETEAQVRFELDPDDPEFQKEINFDDKSASGAYSYRFQDGELYSVHKDPSTGQKKVVANSEYLPGELLESYKEAMAALANGQPEYESQPVRAAMADTATEHAYSIQEYRIVESGMVEVSNRTEMRPIEETGDYDLDSDTPERDVLGVAAPALLVQPQFAEAPVAANGPRPAPPTNKLILQESESVPVQASGDQPEQPKPREQPLAYWLGDQREPKQAPEGLFAYLQVQTGTKPKTPLSLFETGPIELSILNQDEKPEQPKAPADPSPEVEAAIDPSREKEPSRIQSEAPEDIRDMGNEPENPDDDPEPTGGLELPVIEVIPTAQEDKTDAVAPISATPVLATHSGTSRNQEFTIHSWAPALQERSQLANLQTIEQNNPRANTGQETRQLAIAATTEAATQRESLARDEKRGIVSPPAENAPERIIKTQTTFEARPSKPINLEVPAVVPETPPRIAEHAAESLKTVADAEARAVAIEAPAEPHAEQQPETTAVHTEIAQQLPKQEAVTTSGPKRAQFPTKEAIASVTNSQRSPERTLHQDTAKAAPTHETKPRIAEAPTEPQAEQTGAALEITQESPMAEVTGAVQTKLAPKHEAHTSGNRLDLESTHQTTPTHERSTTAKEPSIQIRAEQPETVTVVNHLEQPAPQRLTSNPLPPVVMHVLEEGLEISTVAEETSEHRRQTRRPNRSQATLGATPWTVDHPARITESRAPLYIEPPVLAPVVRRTERPAKTAPIERAPSQIPENLYHLAPRGKMDVPNTTHIPSRPASVNETATSPPPGLAETASHQPEAIAAKAPLQPVAPIIPLGAPAQAEIPPSPLKVQIPGRRSIDTRTHTALEAPTATVTEHNHWQPVVNREPPVPANMEPVTPTIRHLRPEVPLVKDHASEAPDAQVHPLVPARPINYDPSAAVTSSERWTQDFGAGTLPASESLFRSPVVAKPTNIEEPPAADISVLFESDERRGSSRRTRRSRAVAA
ncbi:MAG TPA: hypothetical protein VMS08_04780 [Candidatus Saccharimonadia bacterium]|nr:hypothetical protein [Candidatus Saccharimonadia bacterium]